MKMKILISALFVVHLSFGQSIENTGSRITNEDAQKFLSHHNQVRAEVGVSGLSWSRELSAYAQEWADYLAKNNGCKMEHRKKPNLKGEPLGENLFWGSSSDYYHPIDASTSWYEEKKIYKHGKFGEGNWHGVGHYTQMVWKNTKEVGVGIAICKNGGLMVVASYYPAGNYIGQFPY
jgi:pathogenesis-related protein 1